MRTSNSKKCTRCFGIYPDSEYEDVDDPVCIDCLQEQEDEE